MKKLFIVASVLLFLSSCTADIEYGFSTLSNRNDGRIHRFLATIEQPIPSTKVYADENLKVLWNAGDLLSVFNKSTYNSKFEFVGEDGDNSADFEDVTPSGLHSGNELANIYALYPYVKGNKINNSGTTVTLTLPAEQTYKAHSFGVGANTMIAVTNDSYLAFKNLCGYLQLRLYGNDITVSKVTIRGNNGEKIAGLANASVGVGITPEVTMTASSTEIVTLICDPPVKIGKSSSDYTDFWFVLPPTTFSGGFTITVEDNMGGIYEKTSSKSLTVRRSTLEWMSPLDVIPVYDILEITNYLTFTSEGTTTIKLANYAVTYNSDGSTTSVLDNTNTPTLYFSYDRERWSKWNCSDLTFTTGAPLFICGDNPDGISTMNSSDGRDRTCSFWATGDHFSISGNIMSIINKKDNIAIIPCDACFAGLFAYIVPLVSAPDLSATTLTANCYNCMFRGCTNLVSAPNLPATTLKLGCYRCMFKDCISLQTAPDLNSTDLVEYCYTDMFSGCTRLNHVSCLATNISASYCTYDWLADVAATGTFVKAATMNLWPTENSNGIPAGWTVQNAD